MRVLVAEDEPRIAAAVARGLRREGMAVDVAPDGAAALYKARINPYDVVVLDRDLPELHGDDVCRTLSAEQPRTKVLMLTAARSTDELVARTLARRRRLPDQAVPLRRAGRAAARARPPHGRGPPAGAGGRGRDPRSGDPRGHPRRPPLGLTLKEFVVLQALLEAQGAVVTPEELLERAWDEQLDPLSNIVRMTVMTLRRKLGDPPLIETVRGSGYRV